MLKQELRRLRKKYDLTQSGLAKKLGLTQQAVARWEGGYSSPDPETLLRISEVLKVTVDDLLSGPEQRAGVLPYIAPALTMVPVVGVVRAGYGALAFEEDYGYEAAAVRDPDNYFYLLVKGDSMEPRICDGDFALVRRQPMLDEGDLGVVVYGDGEGTLKRFSRKGSKVFLQPLNPAYETMVISGQELEHLSIAGKVVEIKSKW